MDSTTSSDSSRPNGGVNPTNTFQQLQKIPSMIKSVTDNVLWIAEKNMLMTKNILLDKVDEILNNQVNYDDSSDLNQEIQNLYSLRDTYKELHESLGELINRNSLVSLTRIEIGNVLRSKQLKEYCNLSIGEEAGITYQNLGSLGLKYCEKVVGFQKSIETFLSRAVQEVIDSVEAHKKIFQQLHVQRGILADIQGRKESGSDSSGKLEKTKTELQKLLLEYQRTTELLIQKLNMLHLASSDLLCEAFEKFVEDMSNFYDSANEQFESRIPSILNPTL